MSRSVEDVARSLGLDPAHPISGARAQSWYDTLKAADLRLKEVIVYLMTHKAPASLPDTESIYGAVPYLVEHPDDSGIELPQWVKDFLYILEIIKAVPKSSITHDEWEFLIKAAKENKAVDADGTIYGFKKYEQLDPNWIATMIIREITRDPAPFGASPYHQPNAPDNLTIGVIGDWGTGYATQYAGRNPAQKAMGRLADAGVDYMIHLGDVYYAGTPDAGYGPYDQEERDYFVKLWPGGGPPKSNFMLNSNHEMYCLGKGYVGVGLADPRFAHQNNTSYFLIENANWQIFGLDSAFASPDQTTFMAGGLTAAQIQWMQQQRARAPHKRVMLMSHHNPVTTDGRSLVGAGAASNLWTQALKGLGGKQPDYWYWGHVHNAIVYTGLGAGLPKPFTTHGRCVGHGAIPFGFAWGLAKPGSMSDYTPGGVPLRFETIDSVNYFAHTPVDSAHPYVKNGYAVIALSGSKIVEQIFDEDGVLRWTAPWIGDEPERRGGGGVFSFFKRLFG